MKNDMKNRAMIYLAAALMATCLAQSAPRTQNAMAKGTLHGVVTDPSGAAIPSASVIVTNGNFVQSVSTDETGQYTVTGLAAGHYRVQIHSAGFSTLDRSGLVLSPGYETEADAQLTISAPRQEITVAARLLD
jgi:hypothetical protein